MPSHPPRGRSDCIRYNPTRIPRGAIGRLVLVALGLAGALAAFSASAASAASAPTFATEVAPIVFENCVGCHRPDGVGPFSLQTFEQVHRRARQIAEVVESGYMPPWKPSAGHGPALQGDRRLSAAEKSTLLAWSRGERLPGDLTQLPALPPSLDTWQLGPPDLVLELSSAFTVPAEGIDIYQNFALPVGNEQTRYVRAVEFMPRTSLVVHHASILVDPLGSSEGTRTGMTLDTARNIAGHFIGWTPGQAPYQTYPGTVWELPPHATLDLQVHLLPVGRPVALNPAIGLHFTSVPPTRFTARLQLRAPNIDIPAGESHYVLEESLVLPVSAQALSVYPHAHYLGRDLQIYADHPDGTRQWLLRIPEWDFNWQSDFRFVDPVRIPAGSRITMHYIYDNSAANPRNPSSPVRRVLGGPNSFDEMGEASFQFLLDDPADFEAMQVAQLRYNAEAEGGVAPLLLRMGNEALGAGLEAKARELFRTAVKKDPTYAPAHHRLGMLAEKAGDLAAAEAAYLAAARADNANPDYPLNLARVLVTRGQIDGARALWVNLLESHPDRLDVRLLLAESLMADGQIARAVRVLGTGLELHPESAPLHLRLGEALLDHGDPHTAATHFEAVLAHADPSTEALIVADAEVCLALLHRHVGDITRAARLLEHALGHNPNLPAALMLGVDLAVGENDLATARARAEQLARLSIEDRPPLAAALTNLRSDRARELVTAAYRAVAAE